MVVEQCPNARRVKKMVKTSEEAIEVFLSKKDAFIEKGQFSAPEDQN